MESADSSAEIRHLGITNLHPLETWTINPEFVNLPQNNWPVRGRIDQP